jgi:hypothetical protein
MMGEVAHAFKRLCERWQAIGLVIATHKCEVWSLGNPTAAAERAETLGMKHAARGLVAAGCPLGVPEFVKEHADAAAGKVVQLIERVLALPLSALDKQLLLRRSLRLKMLHLSRVAYTSDVLDVSRKVTLDLTLR